MLKSLEGKNAIVTGAARGIGRAIAERLAAEGARVMVNYAQSHNAAEETVASIVNAGGTAGAFQADVSDPAQAALLFDASAAQHGPLDILVNNAGVAVFRPLAEFTLEEFEEVFRVNARGAFLCLREAARRIRDCGRIVNISTGATVGSPAGGSVYSGSKAAVEQFGRALARELGPRGVTVNTVSPGFTETDMLRQFPDFIAAAPAMTPLGRVGTPGDIADSVLFLCSPEGGWITGQNLQAGGGLNML